MTLFRRNDPRTAIEVTPYQRRNRYEVREMLFRSFHSHIHLDWHETDQWLDAGRSPVLVAWNGRRIVGVLAASEPLDGECWIRLAAVQDGENPLPIIETLWNVLKLDLRALNVHRVAVLILREWLSEVFDKLLFHEFEWIVTLRRESRDAPPEMHPAALAIRPADPVDYEAIVRVDHEAFGPLWQMTPGDLRQAMRNAASCTVGLIDNAIIAYQLSTMYFDGSHLARLAVVPTLQARGIGAALVGDVLRRFSRRGVNSMTVNTQLSNERSQRLYQRLGFARNGYDLAVWTADLAPK
ncbi:MAG: GNAT family N-acetyltransferase [Anaerolineae bacterium]